MAASATVSSAIALTVCNAVVDALDAGSGAGKLCIYSGTRPDRTDVAITDQTLLVTLVLNDPAFGDAADDGTNSKATATCDIDPAVSNTAVATNTASWFRAYDSDDNGCIDGSVGTADADAILDTTSIVTNATVTLTSWTFSVGEGTKA